jgi:hypothetical protein
MYNDLFGWLKDERHANLTYFLSEANRRRDNHETIASWVAREGFDWGIDKLNGWMAELNTLARQLNSPALQAYLATRQTMLLNQQQKATSGLPFLVKLSQQAGQKESTNHEQSNQTY